MSHFLREARLINNKLAMSKDSKFGHSENGYFALIVNNNARDPISRGTQSDHILYKFHQIL